MTVTQVYRQLKLFFQVLRLSESVLALPLVFIGMFSVSTHFPSGRLIFLATLALLSGRGLGMMLNRLIDEDIDRKNVRTSHRILPSGKMSRKQAWFYALGLSLVFIFTSYGLNWLCFILSPLVILCLWAYSYMKRYTYGTHFFLGGTESIAPVAGAIAVTPAISWPPILLSIYTFLWISGLDICYACQDEAFDRKEGLYSIPVRLGRERSLKIAYGLHSLAIIFWVTFGWSIGGSNFFYGASIILGFFFYFQHFLLSRDIKKLEKRIKTFFLINKGVSLLALLIVFLDQWVLSGRLK